MLKNRRHKKIIIISGAVVVFLLAGAFAFLGIVNIIFNNVFCAYKTSQYIACENDSAASITIYIIDSTGFMDEFFPEEEMHSPEELTENSMVYFTTADGDLSVSDNEGNIFAATSYLVEILKGKNTLSGYSLYELTVSFQAENDSTFAITTLTLGEKDIDIGTIVVDTMEVAEKEEDVSIGVSPTADESGDFNFYVSNNGAEEIELVSVEYFLDGETYNLLGEEVAVIEPGEEYDGVYNMDNAGISAFCPKIIFSRGGAEYVYVPAVTTNLLTELGDDDIRAYLKSLNE